MSDLMSTKRRCSVKGALKESASLKEEFLPAAGRDALWAELSECCFL
jgi:hypothetical protein